MFLSPTLPIWHRCLIHDSILADIEHFLEEGGDASISKSDLARLRGFEVKKAGAKGLGVFALQKFYRGDLVIAEAPLFSIRREPAGVHNAIQYRCGTIEAAIDALTPEQRKEYESLDNTEPSDMCGCGIFSTNSFEIDEDDSVKIFLQSSRFNHSCIPNARYSWNPEVKRFRIYAFRDIARGEDIFVTYLGWDMYCSTRAERQVRLRALGFTCKCAVCTQPNTAASDKRRVRIKKIFESRR
jgi:SET domain-containing protein